MKVSVTNSATGKMKPSRMKIGEVARILHALYDGVLIMRTYDRFISLNDPSVVWSDNPGPWFDIEILPPGTEIKLVTE